MNQESSRMLIVEIKTIDSASFNVGQLRKMLIYQDSSRNCFVSIGVEEIKRAIIEAIPHLDRNYHHSLSFDVQVIRGNESDAIIASADNSSGKRRRRRRSREH